MRKLGIFPAYISATYNYADAARFKQPLNILCGCAGEWVPRTFQFGVVVDAEFQVIAGCQGYIGP